MSLVRQKRSFLIIFTFALLLYVNWYISVKKAERTYAASILVKRQQDNSNNEKHVLEIYAVKSSELRVYHERTIETRHYHDDRHESSVVEEVNDLVPSVDRKSNENDSRKENQDVDHIFDFSSLQKLTLNDLGDLFALLHSNRVCLLQPNALEDIHRLANETNETSDYRFDLLKIFDLKSAFDEDGDWPPVSDFSTESDKRPFLTFGVGYLNVENLQKDLNEKMSSRCNLVKKNMRNSNKDMKIPTSFYVMCNQFTMHICVIYRRGSFLWIPIDDNKEDEQSKRKVFGDTTRAVHKFDLKEIKDANKRLDLKVYVPHDIPRFIFDYKHSRFIECNKQLAKYNLKAIGPKYRQDEKKNKMVAPVIRHITQTLESLGKHYWLAGGTLLGWYRDCGIIPYTLDVDIALWSHEYDGRVKERFLGDQIVRVWSTLGLVNDSFEFRLFNDVFTFDMFLVYPFNSTDQWCGYQVNRTKYRRFLPYFDKLCSAELLSQKLLVPCDPEAYLKKEYGTKGWRTPLSKNYRWENVKFWRNWTDHEWLYTVRYFDRAGQLIKNKTLDHLNRFLSVNMTQVDFDRLV